MERCIAPGLTHSLGTVTAGPDWRNRRRVSKLAALHLHPTDTTR
jgi:hypothetical protein